VSGRGEEGLALKAKKRQQDGTDGENRSETGLRRSMACKRNSLHYDIKKGRM
jgi:hypothetical protein